MDIKRYIELADACMKDAFLFTDDGDDEQSVAYEARLEPLYVSAVKIEDKPDECIMIGSLMDNKGNMTVIMERRYRKMKGGYKPIE